jgi:hypothetical protein
LEYWEQVPETKERFDALSMAMKRYFLNYINTVKSPVKKAERTHLLMSNLLIAPKGKEQFRQLLGKE